MWPSTAQHLGGGFEVMCIIHRFSTHFAAVDTCLRKWIFSGLVQGRPWLSPAHLVSKLFSKQVFEWVLLEVLYDMVVVM